MVAAAALVVVVVVLRRLPPAKSLKNQLDLIDSLIELIIINRIVGIINVIRPIAIADLPLDLNPETTLEPVAPEAMVIHEVQRHVIIEVRVEVAHAPLEHGVHVDVVDHRAAPPARVAAARADAGGARGPN